MGDERKTEDLDDVDGGEDSSVADWVDPLDEVDGGAGAILVNSTHESDPLEEVDAGFSKRRRLVPVI